MEASQTGRSVLLFAIPRDTQCRHTYLFVLVASSIRSLGMMYGIDRWHHKVVVFQVVHLCL